MKNMPLTYQDRKDYYPSISLQGWRHEGERIFRFLDNGRDYHAEYGLTYVYAVEHEGEKQSLWVRPDGPLAIGLLAMLSEEKPELKGRTFKITKTTGERRADTRYTAEEIE